jgi:acyl-coenzyme A synthetase/AMP-(fatty) acid ligase
MCPVMFSIDASRWEIALASIRSGIILSPAPTLCTKADIRYRCNQSKASVFVGDIISVRKFLAVRSDCPYVKTVIQVGDAASENVISFHSALESIPSDSKAAGVRRPWSAPALTYFTSGTSGSPKMVRHNQVSYPFGESRMRTTLRLFTHDYSPQEYS